MVTLAIVLLLLIWIPQAILMTRLYRMIKTNEAEELNSILTKNFGKDNFTEVANELSSDNLICIKLINLTNSFSEDYDSHGNSDCVLHRMNFTNDLYEYYYNKALEKNNTFIEYVSRNKVLKSNVSEEESTIQNANDRKNDSLIISNSLTASNGDKYLLILETSIEPIYATKIVFVSELIIISAVSIIIAFIISFILSKNMSSPIVDINEKAKKLSDGNFDIQFDEKGTKETIELSRTLNEMTTQLSKVNTMQKELIANISHDLRTPLTMISGYSEVMRDIPGENTPENIQVIIDETERLSSLVNDLLSISQLQSPNSVINISKINLTKLVEESIKRYDKLTSHNGYKIDFEYSEEVYVNVDKTRILQVLYNLINNAINYTGEDKLVHIKQSVEDNIVRISIKDTGNGISQEDLPYIWDRYYRVDKVHKRAVVGTGLGLSIVKEILLLHNSRFGVSSEEGKGSTFWFELKIDN